MMNVSEDAVVSSSKQIPYSECDWTYLLLVDQSWYVVPWPTKRGSSEGRWGFTDGRKPTGCWLRLARLAGQRESS